MGYIQDLIFEIKQLYLITWFWKLERFNWFIYKWTIQISNKPARYHFPTNPSNFSDLFHFMHDLCLLRPCGFFPVHEVPCSLLSDGSLLLYILTRRKIKQYISVIYCLYITVFFSILATSTATRRMNCLIELWGH